MMRQNGGVLNLSLSSLRTRDIVEQLKELQIEFGLLRDDGVERPLRCEKICKLRYAIFVPRSLAAFRRPSLKEALLQCPHAAISGDGQLMKKLRDLARKLGGDFVPELTYNTIPQCVAAVETGAFAAVIPMQTWKGSSASKHIVVEDAALTPLSRQIVVAWHPRTIEVMGAPAERMKSSLIKALKQASEAAGASCS